MNPASSVKPNLDPISNFVKCPCSDSKLKTLHTGGYDKKACPNMAFFSLVVFDSTKDEPKFVIEQVSLA